jgi:hypothetical protein
MEENVKGNCQVNLEFARLDLAGGTAPSRMAGAYVSGPWVFFGAHNVGATWTPCVAARLHRPALIRS